jgi:hypothetical protein
MEYLDILETLKDESTMAAQFSFTLAEVTVFTISGNCNYVVEYHYSLHHYYAHSTTGPCSG